MAKRKNVEVIHMTTKDMMILPPAPDKCQICATAHESDLPHNQQSLFYQMKFHQENDRFPTWNDAMERCTSEMKYLWSAELKKHGIDLDNPSMRPVKP